MHPFALVAITFGLWIVAKGEAPKYWALATTPNASKGATATSGTTSSTGAGAGSVSPSSLPALPALDHLPNLAAIQGMH